MSHDVMSLMGNPIFWIFGGGVIIALAGIIGEAYAKTLRLRQRNLELMLQQRQTAEGDLMAVSPTEFENLRQRVDMVERDLEELRQARGLPPGTPRLQQLRRVAEPEVVHPPVEDLETHT